MSDSSRKMRIFVETFRLMEDVQWVGGDVSGRIPAQHVAGDLEERLDEDGNLLNFDNQGQYVALKFHTNFPEGELFTEDWTSLLEYKTSLVQTPTDFYVAEDDYWHLGRGNKTDSRNFSRYSAVLKLIELLRKIANHEESDEGYLKLIFFHEKKLELVVRYGAADMAELSGFSSLLDLLGSTPHEEQKQVILKVVLIETLQNLPSNDRFIGLLAAFGDICIKVKDNYELYVSGFSFEAAREKLEEQKMEYMVKLNAVLTEIQNKFLAIPLALLLAGGQMEDKGAFTWKNCSILAGAMLFGILMIIMVTNQKQTLSSIWEEIDLRSKRYQKQSPVLYDQVKGVFEGLRKRHDHQLVILNVLKYAAGCGMLLTFWVFYKLTPELWVLPDLVVKLISFS
ncbi:MAG: hypothetical protein HQL80_02440 [Magnetococcales bacterium]|nr:hypothetical protein [Magnetococcales bacterium]